MEDNINMSLMNDYIELCKLYNCNLYELDLDNDIDIEEVCEYFNITEYQYYRLINDLKMEGF